MNAIPKFSEQIESIELARLESQAIDIANDLVALSSPTDTVSVINMNSIHIAYVGRGSEAYDLSLSNEFSVRTRIAYLTDVVLRLSKIKQYILEDVAA